MRDERKQEIEEMAMKAMRWLATVIFVVAGIALLCIPSHATEIGVLAGSLNNSAGGVGAKIGGMGVGAYAPTRFTVTDEGTAGKPDVVLIPGLASSKDVWDAEAKLLMPNYNLHLVQVDGFAGAPAGANGMGTAGNMLPGIVEQLHGYVVATKMRPMVVGHSLGGLLAMMWAEKYPEDLRKMVIVDTLPYYAVLFNPKATVETTKPMAAGMKEQMVAAPADQYAAMQQPMMAAMVKDPAGLKAVLASSLASDRGVVAEAMYEDLTTDLRADVGRIQTPTLVMYEFPTDGAAADGAVKYEQTIKEAYQPMPKVTLVKMDGSRHFIMYDQPAKFDAALEAFLK